MWKKITIVLYVIIVSIVLYYIGNIVFERYLKNTVQNEPRPLPKNENLSPLESPQNLADETAITAPNERTDTYGVSRADCKNECSDVPEGLHNAYCRNVCGLTPIATPSDDRCSDTKDLSRDYCLRDNAVSKKDPSACEEINDKSIFEQCKNRILEDIVDESF